jgi:hypothetical protein
LIAADEQDRSALKGLGTYGLIKGARGFIVGAMSPHEKNLEDYGYVLEQIILFATDLGLGTCWLGGNFTKSSFSKKISASHEESVPAVISIGYFNDPQRARNSFIRQRIGADRRLPWGSLFFNREFGAPLTHEEADGFATPLNMVRLGPSASNKQPWRIIKDSNSWHFYMQRTPGYRYNLVSRLLSIEDLQRVDMGIAMCHFELTTNELGLKGKWGIQEPFIEKPDPMTEYTVSWNVFASNPP